MNSRLFWIVIFCLICIIGPMVILLNANTPGKPSVTLTWQDPSCVGCTYNLYRGSAAGVCSGTPIPYASGIVPLSYIDTLVTVGSTYVYAVSAVPTVGGESACSTEVQIAVQTAQTPSNLQAH